MTLLTHAGPSVPSPEGRSGTAGAEVPVGRGVKELRLALVCDGGVSLAIYIHGITKELQHLVRAARSFDDFVAAPERLDEIRRGLEQTQRAYFDALHASAEPTTVTIDVISGTSAGGINGVFLAKGLARNVPQEPLTKLWIDNGDLRKLTHSLFPSTWAAILQSAFILLFRARTGTGWSPLDGKLMSTWLMQALGDMDGAGPVKANARSLLPADHDLDLFVTGTNLAGYQRSFAIDGAAAGEQYLNHRKVFTFNSADPEKNDGFGPADNLGLAFAARCTSSFPGAFPPVNLQEFTAIAAPDGSLDGAAAEFAKRQLREYSLAGIAPLSTYFVDGGVLDNSPFDHAIAAIAAKSAAVRVDRRIVHINPDPAQPAMPDLTKPVVQQALTWVAGLRKALGVMSSQSVVGDLCALEQLNQAIESVGSITEGLHERVERLLTSAPGSVPAPSWANAKASSEAARRQIPALAGDFNVVTYERLKVTTIAEMFAMDLADALDFPADSRQAFFLKGVLTTWFNELDSVTSGPQPDLGDFLQAADLPYRERRLRFLISYFNELFTDRSVDCPAEVVSQLKSHSWGQLSSLLHFRAAAARAVRNVAASFLAADRLASAVDPGDFAALHAPDMERLVAAYRHELAGYAAGNPAEQLQVDLERYSRPLPADVQQDLLHRYVAFPLWDVLIFPVIALSKLPQLSPIKLSTFSPAHATMLLDPASGERKLQGTSVHRFGGFFRQVWRQNDYVWGRLDGAELILRLLGHPDTAEGDQVYAAAFTAILDVEQPMYPKLQRLLTKLRERVDRRGWRTPVAKPGS